MSKREDMIFIRVSPEEKARFEDAARREGLAPSTWLRRLGLMASDAAARPTTFVPTSVPASPLLPSNAQLRETA